MSTATVITNLLGLPPDAAPVVFACGAVVATLVIWAMKPPKLPPAPKPAGVIENGVLWRADSVGQFVSTPARGITHVWACMERTVTRFPGKKAVGQRPLVKREMVADPADPSRKFEKLTLGEYEWMTYREYHARVCAFAAGMVKATGLQPKERIVIYGETQRDWMVAALAAFRQGIAIVTIYATLGEEGVVHGINQTKATSVVADSKLLSVLVKAAPSCKQLKHVITIDATISAEDKIKLEALGVTVTSMDACIEAGKEAPMEPANVTSEHIAVIMYTSGTTGLPKGVLISHGNFMAGVAGTHQALGSFMEQAVDDVYLAYLPLAHIMEMMVEVTNMSWGVAIGYGSPHTLTNTGVKLAAGQTGDAPLLQPTVMVFAPAVLDKVYSAIQTKVSKASPLVQKLFHMGLATGVRNFNAGGVGAGPIFNTLVFKKIQALLGGRVRAMITGSAPLSADVQKFVQTVFNCPVRQGYGLTETCAGSVMAFLGDNSTSCVGAPTAAACIRLRDWPEGNYLSSDKDKPDIGMPRGEVLIGGPMVTQGYLIDPDNIDEDVAKKNETEYVTIEGVRYFCSGDIGQINKDGNLQIIDRKKDLVKLQQGEYVALSKVENALKISEYVEIPMCYAHSSKSFCIALICPSVPHLQTLAQSKGIDASDIEGLCKNKDIIAEVSKSCLAACKQSKLVGFEIPKKIALISDPWTPENDMLTAAMKLKRQPIVARHKDEIDAIYQ